MRVKREVPVRSSYVIKSNGLFVIYSVCDDPRESISGSCRITDINDPLVTSIYIISSVSNRIKGSSIKVVASISLGLGETTISCLINIVFINRIAVVCWSG